MKICEACGAWQEDGQFYVSSANGGKVHWQEAKLNTRVCQYRKVDKPCLNQCTDIIPSETFEARSQMLDGMIDRAIAQKSGNLAAVASEFKN